ERGAGIACFFVPRMSPACDNDDGVGEWTGTKRVPGSIPLMSPSPHEVFLMSGALPVRSSPAARRRHAAPADLLQDLVAGNMRTRRLVRRGRGARLMQLELQAQPVGVLREPGDKLGDRRLLPQTLAQEILAGDELKSVFGLRLTIASSV